MQSAALLAAERELREEARAFAKRRIDAVHRIPGEALFIASSLTGINLEEPDFLARTKTKLSSMLHALCRKGRVGSPQYCLSKHLALRQLMQAIEAEIEKQKAGFPHGNPAQPVCGTKGATR